MTPIAFGNVLKAVAITGCDSKAKTMQAAMTRKFEPFKTTAPPHPEWIG